MMAVVNNPTPITNKTMAIIRQILRDFSILYLLIIISGGKGRKKYIKPRMISAPDAPYKPNSGKKEKAKIKIPIDSTQIPLTIIKSLENFSFRS